MSSEEANLASSSSSAAGATKGWRWIAEMEEIAHSMAEAGLPDGFHQAAAEIFRRCPHLPSAAADGDVLSEVLAALTA